MIKMLEDISHNYIEILNNIVILFGLGFLYAASNVKTKSKKPIAQVSLGMLIGVLVWMTMINPWSIREGYIFDVRSIVISVSAYFFGLIPALSAVIIPSLYRIYVGGSGVISGLITITISTTIGLLWRYLRQFVHIKHQLLEYYLFGLVVNFVVWFSFIIMPRPVNFELMNATFIPFVILFPVVSMLLLLVIRNQINRMDVTKALQEKEILLKSIIDSTREMEIFALDTNFKYLAFNKFHEASIKAYYDKSIKPGDDYLSNITNDQMKNRIASFLNQVVQGETLVKTVEIETTNNKFYEERYTPIISNGVVEGVTVISYEVTERKNYESSILLLSYYDHLTGLGNRRLYQEKLQQLNLLNDFPVTFIMADINGLKLMNDAFSHDAGDDLLVRAASFMKNHFENYGTVCRIGGDEFVIILPRTDEKFANHLVSQIDHKLEESSVKGIQISISFGVASAESMNEINLATRKAEENMYAHKVSSISSSRNLLIKALQKTLYEKNPREEAHCKRVSIVAKALGEKLGLDNEQLGLLEVISYLHDIGKIAIDEDILNKTDDLTPQEWEKIKKHPEIGYRILSTAPEYFEVATDILSHHERYDGNGYPRSLKENQIPLRARILSIADAYDAMVNKRSYNKLKSHEEAIKELLEHRGTQFDPKLVDLFIKEFKDKPFFNKKDL